MGSVLPALAFLCCSLPGAELKTIRIVVASNNDTTTEIADEQVKIVADTLAQAAPEGMLEGFHYEDGILTAFGYLPHRKARQEIFRATHMSDSPTGSVFQVETVVSRFLVKRITRKVAEIWSRVRHPELKDSLVPEVTIEGNRVEALFVEPEVVVPENNP